jgi:RNA polymerase sigma factor (sigma-70 family)
MTESDCADEILMRQFQDALDEKSFRLLASRHYDGALRLAQKRVGNYSTAQDAVQEALVRVVRYRKRYDSSKPFAPWFHTILRNVCTDMMRQDARRRKALASLTDETLPLPMVAPWRERVVDLLAGLPEGGAQLLLRRFVCGMSLGELAVQCQSSQEAIKKRIQRLIQRLRG